MTQAENAKLQLTVRAYEFINESLRNAERSAGEGGHLWVFAISNVAQGLELLLKERLRREHPILVYADIDKGRTNTVTFTQALQRLERCGVQIADADLRKIRIARDLRNALVHFVPSVTEEQLRAAYVDFFEFAHVFHFDQMGEELHPHVDRDLWAAEALLMEEFERQFVAFQGATVINYWPSELLEAQFWPAALIDGIEYDRVRYGNETGWGDREPTNCHDCAALPGQVHGPGCDTEECPKCHAQFISCDCDASWVEQVNSEALAHDTAQAEAASNGDTRRRQVPPQLNRDGSQEEWARHMRRHD